MQVNGVKIFQAVEQRYGQMKDAVCVYFHPEHRNDLFMKGFSLKHECEIKTSFVKQTKKTVSFANIKQKVRETVDSKRLML